MGGAATVFVSGLSVMVLELVAGRLVAPYFGQSTCTWAALTGVTLAGVSAGNAFGGWLSSKVGRPMLVSAVALAVGGTLCVALQGVLPFLNVAISAIGSFEARTAAFVIVAWLPPTLALGCVTPSVAAACVRPERNGRDLGILYFASMAGSAAGSVLGGLLLPFAWPSDTLYLFFGAVLATMALAAAAMGMRSDRVAEDGARVDGSTHGAEALNKPTRPMLLVAVFAVGWFGMGVELAGARLVTPILGGNHIVWSLIFITFIGTMGVGGWIGGVVADRWPRVETAIASLVALAAVACATVWAEASLLPKVLSEAGAVQRLLGFTVLAFSPLGVVLGAVSTALLKFATTDALRRGDRSVVGFMYATASAGSVCGTFVTGFALVGKISSAALCVLLSAMLVLTAIVLARRFRTWGMGNSVLFRACAVGIFVAAVAVFCELRTPQVPLEVCRDDGWKVLFAAESRYNVVTVSALSGNASIRTIWLDRIPHTTVDTRRRSYLHTSYTRMLDEVVTGLLDGNDAPSLFMIGGGGYALPRKWTSASGRKWSRLVVAEIDGTVTDAALGFLDAAPEVTNGVCYAEGDGRRILDDLLAGGGRGRFNVVVGDTISDAAIPYHLATREFNERVKSLLNPDGAYVMHLLDRLDSPGLLASTLKTLSATWHHVGAVAYQQVDDVRQSFVVVASDDPAAVDMQRYAATIAKTYPESWPLVIGDAEARELAGRDYAVMFTDRFAPMERFVWEVVFKTSDKRAERDAADAKSLLAKGDGYGALAAAASALAKVPELPEAIEALRCYCNAFPEDVMALRLLAEQSARKSAGCVAKAAYASVLAMRGDSVGAERLLGELMRRFPGRMDFARGWAINAAKSGKRSEAKAWLDANKDHFSEYERDMLARQIDEDGE